MFRTLVLTALVTALLQVPGASQPVITTFAGRDVVFRGEGERAENVTLGSIRGVAIDSSGRIVFTDADFGLVLRLGSNNVLEVIAGTGVLGFSGDNGPAREARLGRVAGIAVDREGNIYVADGGRVRKISATGIITTFAGGGTSREEDIPAIEALLLGASGIAVDAEGNVYVTEMGQPRVRRISPEGRIRTIAGTGQQVFGPPPSNVGDGGPATAAILVAPIDVVADRQGAVLIVDSFGDRVRRVGSDGIIRTVVGGAPPGPPPVQRTATNISIIRPSGMAIAPDGSMYVMTVFEMLKVAPDQRVTSVNNPGIGLPNNGGPVTAAGFKTGGLNAMVSDAEGNIYIADSGNYQLRRIGTDGFIHAFAGTGVFRQEGENWPAASAYFNSPTRLAASRAGQLFILDRENCRIREIQSNGLVRTVAGNGICSTVGGSNYSFDGLGATSIGFGGLSAVAAGPNGDLYVLDVNRVVRVMADGRLAAVVNRRSIRLNPPGDDVPAVDASLDAFGGGIAFDSAGNLYIAEVNTHRIRKVTPGGIISTIVGSGPTSGAGSFSGDGGPAIEARLNRPLDVAFDHSGAMFILDSGNSRIRKVTPDGIITTLAITSGPPSFWSQLAIDPAGGVYLADPVSHRVRQIGAGGAITDFAGTGQPGFSGDGGRPDAAQLAAPSGVAVDSAGNVFIADTGNHRIRQATVK